MDENKNSSLIPLNVKLTHEITFSPIAVLIITVFGVFGLVGLIAKFKK